MVMEAERTTVVARPRARVARVIDATISRVRARAAVVRVVARVVARVVVPIFSTHSDAQ